MGASVCRKSSKLPVLNPVLRLLALMIPALDPGMEMRDGPVGEADGASFGGPECDLPFGGRDPVLDGRAEDTEPDHRLAQQRGLMRGSRDRGGAWIASTGYQVFSPRRPNPSSRARLMTMFVTGFSSKDSAGPDLDDISLVFIMASTWSPAAQPWRVD